LNKAWNYEPEPLNFWGAGDNAPVLASRQPLRGGSSSAQARIQDARPIETLVNSSGSRGFPHSVAALLLYDEALLVHSNLLPTSAEADDVTRGKLGKYEVLKLCMWEKRRTNLFRRSDPTCILAFPAADAAAGVRVKATVPASP
jgi:hypothetical protein